MKKLTVPGFIITLLATVSLAGCEKKSGEAVVLAKEHIAAAPRNAETPKCSILGWSE
jgi:hypothetical protein